MKAAMTEMAIKGVMEREHTPTGSLRKGEMYSVSKIEWDGIRLYCTQISVLFKTHTVLLGYSMCHFWLEVCYRTSAKPQVSENHYPVSKCNMTF